MQKKRMALLCVVLAALLSAVLMISGFSRNIDNITVLQSLEGGKTLLVSEQGEKTALEIVNASGVVDRRYERRRSQHGEVLALVGAAVDDQGRILALEDRRDPLTGAYLGQDLAYYAPGLLFGREIRRVSLEDGEVRYRWIAQTGSLILIGTNEGETTLYRTALDLDAFCDDGQALVKSTREYPVYGGEGVYQALETGRRMVYLSRSGKAFVSDEEGQAQELYPARILERLMYPFFLASNTTESVIIGEKDSGDILTLSLQDGSTNVLRPGTESFPGMGYQTADLSAVSMRDIQNYTGAVAGEEGYTLIVCRDGAFKSFNRIRFSLLGAAWDFFSQWILWSAAFLILGMGCLSLVQRVCAGRTILMKLLWTAGTLIVAVDLLFGAFSFFSYRSRVLEELCQQAQQEGALLMQMVDEEDWHGVEYPYDYGNACYRRMSQSLAQQQPEGRTAYYEEGQLYTGAGEGTACFYPVETLLNASLTSLYQEAALSGQASVGRVQDARGERVVCITPSGGLSGSSVYLVETGVYLAQLKTGLSAFLLRYLLFGAIASVGVFVLVVFFFRSFLEPVGRIKAGLEAFSRGERAVRLQYDTNDEFADICRVFNKMAGDIDAQFYTLRAISETYYRFIPKRMFRLLGKENLEEVELGTHVQGRFSILCVDLSLEEEQTPMERQQELVSRFFGIVNTVVDGKDATVLSDRLNLRRLRVLCSDSDTAVRIALAVIARLDSYNVSKNEEERLEVTFLLHLTEAYFGICGDQQRYFPTVISQELEQVSHQSARFGMLYNRLLVTSRAYGSLDPSQYYNRFIGYLDDGREMGLYDFYDGTSVQMTRLLNDTRATFDKAMELYHQGRYYDAKNLFATVLRENRGDSVARYYIFGCEKHLE